jgi:PREDICTED: voltage-dependent anion channel 2-like
VASFETKQVSKDYKTTLKEKWTTDNTLTTEATIEDQFMTGLKLGGNVTFTPYSGKKAAILKSAYKMDNVHLNADMDFTQSYVLMHGAAVFK